MSLVFYSDEKCSDQVPNECNAIIPYTNYPNVLFGLADEREYQNLTETIRLAAQDCTLSESRLTWNLCNLLYPRCLLSYPLYLCRHTCLGMLLSQSYPLLSKENISF